jgi:hypothetical protein
MTTSASASIVAGDFIVIINESATTNPIQLSGANGFFEARVVETRIDLFNRSSVPFSSLTISLLFVRLLNNRLDARPCAIVRASST